MEDNKDRHSSNKWDGKPKGNDLNNDMSIHKCFLDEVEEIEREGYKLLGPQTNLSSSVTWTRKDVNDEKNLVLTPSYDLKLYYCPFISRRLLAKERDR